MLLASAFIVLAPGDVPARLIWAGILFPLLWPLLFFFSYWPKRPLGPVLGLTAASLLSGAVVFLT